MKGGVMVTMQNGIWGVFDLEGPWVLNDNAFESTAALAEMCGLRGGVGALFYHRMSVIDDIWGDYHRISKDPAYSSGHTLKVVLPFFKAMSATAEWLELFARENLRVVPHTETVLPDLDRTFNVRLVSTSYGFFVRAFCNAVGFDFAQAFYTAVPGFDAVKISKAEAQQLLDFMREVAEMPVIEYSRETGVVIPAHQAYYDRITNFVWELVYGMPVGQLLQTVHPVGQTQKRETLERILRGSGVPMERAIYLGDSQTDLQCAKLLQGRGLTMMFNGKGPVCEISDIMYIGRDARAIEEVANRFDEMGRDGVIRYYSPPRQAECGGLLAAVTPENFEKLHEMSVAIRKDFRGDKIGSLT